MKTKLLMLLVAASGLFTTRAMAQNVFTTNNSHVVYRWYEKLNNPQDPLDGITTDVHYFTATTDTIINGKNYQKMYYEATYERSSGATGIIYEPSQLLFCTRYDTTLKNVYVVFKDSTNEHLFYKFNVHIGDTLHNIIRMQYGTYYTTSLVVVPNLPSYSNRDVITLNHTTNNNQIIVWYNNIGTEITKYQGEVFHYLDVSHPLLVCHSDTTVALFNNYQHCINLNFKPPQSISQNVFTTIKLITNPVTDVIQLQGDNLSSYTYIITTLYGTIVQKGTLPINGIINSQWLVSGVYILHVNNLKQKLTTFKLLKY